MKYLISTLLFLSFASAVYALPEKEAGEFCGGWNTAGRTSLDDQVFFSCVEAKMKDKKFVESLARKKHARQLCAKTRLTKRGKCIQKMLRTPSRLAIRNEVKQKGRGVASKKDK